MLLTLLGTSLLAVHVWIGTKTVSAQNLTIPGNWRKPSSNLSREDRESLAHDAAYPLSKIQISIGTPGLPHLQEITSLYAVLALQDFYSGNGTWHDLGAVNLPTEILGSHGFFSGKAKLHSDVIYWGLTYFYAHRTYNEDILLQNAVEAWNIVYSGGFIDPTAAATSSGAGRNVSFPPSSNCTGGTFAGGVFYRADILSDTSVNMETVGTFMTLSAYLFEKTQNVTYHDSAQLSLEFILNYLWNGVFVYDTRYLDSCGVQVKPFTMNQGWFVEGLSVWANVTKNGTLTTLLETVVTNVTTYPSWTLQDGVVDDTDPSVTLDSANAVLKGIYIRGLAEAHRRNPGTALASYIEAYIYVQLNSMLDNARAPPPNNSAYSRSWDGPPATSFVEAGGNIAALDVLNAAFSFVEPSAPSASSSSMVGQTPTEAPLKPVSTKSRSTTGAIAGAVVGGVVAAAAVIAIFVLWRRRRTAEARNRSEGELDSDGIKLVEPFFSPIAQNPPPSDKQQRMNELYLVNSSPPLSQPASEEVSSTPEPDSPRDNNRESAIAELPGLVDRLYTLMHGRGRGELPPRYGD
ncbi:unnamed protein product [Peniophora sp. CBMAI 1063]|nr:unnamed protein product [Peniophora sp. CBMAI 1063]